MNPRVLPESEWKSYFDLASKRLDGERAIVFNILSRVGTETRNVVIGTILVGFVIAFLVPSTTAQVARLVPITLGIIAAFGAEKKRIRRHDNDHDRSDRQPHMTS